MIVVINYSITKSLNDLIVKFFVVKQFCTSEPGIDFSCNLV
jgi:hypothetical protein